MTKKQLKETLYNSLRELGLTDHESDLYVTSLSLGPTTISAIAKHMNLARPNVYKLIAGLEEHGLAKFSERQKYTRTFVVEPPTAVLGLIRKKKENVHELDHGLVAAMPDLLGMYHQGETPTKVKVLVGQGQYLKLFRGIIEEENHESVFFGSAQDFIGLVTWEVENDWIKMRLKHGITMRSLLLPSAAATELQKSDKEQLRETRVLQSAASFATSFQLFSNKAILWQPKAPLAVLIEDEYIVQMLKSVFDYMWTQHRPPVQPLAIS
ncbi:MAG: hypothetical protein HY092_03035 [Candidatus Kerfeldbacteria bacterium]|nr:hypothetical protein [Candidatus Kerfeldbacteria bacterium]